MERIVTFGKCFADPIAVRIMRVTYRGPLTIQDLQEILELDRHTVDLRLTKLRDAQILKFQQDGKWLSYYMNPEAKPIVKSVLMSFYDEVKWNPECLEDDRRFKRLRELATTEKPS